MSKFANMRYDALLQHANNMSGGAVEAGPSHEGGFWSAAHDIFIRGPVKGTAQIMQDLGGLTNWAGRNTIGYEPFDSRDLGGDPLEGTWAPENHNRYVRGAADFVSEATRFIGEASLTGGAARLGISAVAGKAGVYGEMLASDLTHLSGTAGNLWRLARGGANVSRAGELLSLGARAGHFGALGFAQALGSGAEGDQLPEKSVRFAADNLMFDTGLGVLGWGAKKVGGAALRYFRQTSVGAKLDEVVANYERGATAKRLARYSEMTDDELRVGAESGKLPKDIADAYINRKYDKAAPEQDLTGPNRQAFIKALEGASESAGVGDASATKAVEDGTVGVFARGAESAKISKQAAVTTVALHDALASVLAHTTAYGKSIGKVPEALTVDGYYGKLMAELGSGDAASATQEFVAQRLGRPTGPAGSPAGTGDAGVDGVRQAVEGNVPQLDQGIRGQVTFNGDLAKDGTALIRLFQGADPSTLFHESAHIFRRFLPQISSELTAKADAWVGASEGVAWTRVQEEQWATAFEKYVSEGVAPTKDLEGVFELTKAWLADTYRNIMNSPLDMQLDPKIKEVFDNMLGGASISESPAVASAQLSEAVDAGIKAGLSPAEVLDQGTKKTINLSHFDTTERVLQLMDADAETILKMVDASVENTQTHEQWVSLARKIGAEDVLPMLKSTLQQTRMVAAKIVAGKMRVASLFEEANSMITRLSDLEAVGDLGNEYRMLQAQVDRRLAAGDRLSAMTVAIQREVARGTTAGNVTISTEGLSEDSVKRVLKLLDPKDPESKALNELAEKEVTAIRDATEKQLDALDVASETPATTPPEPSGSAEVPEGQGSPGIDPGASTPAPGAQQTPTAPAGPKGPAGTPQAPQGKPSGTGGVPGGGPGGNPGNISPARWAYYRRIQQAVNAGQPAATAKLGQAAKASKLGAIMELWISGLLSGMKTLVVNITSNGLYTALAPIIRAVGELVSLTPSPRRALQALGMYHEWVGAAMDMWNASRISGGDFRGFRAVADAFKKETSIFDQNLTTQGGPQFVASTFGLSNNSVRGKVVNAVGTAFRTPGQRLLSATDELFTNLNYIAKIRSEARARAADLVASGVIKANQIGAYIDSIVKSGFDAGGATADANGDPLFAEAYAYAKDLGFKTPLGKLGESIIKLRNDHPWMNFILPFIKTPVNIFKAAARMTPGVGLAVNALEARSGRYTVEQLARHRGEMVMGMGFWGLAGYLAANGRLTGRGPANQLERQQLMASGWQPNSIVIQGEDGKDKYISFNRFEPVASALGMAADAYDVWANGSDQDVTKIASTMMESFIRNASSKTYIKGLGDFFRVMSDPTYASTWLRQTAATAVVPAAIAQFATSTDEDVRTANTISESIRRRVPGLSETLPPRRNILGEPITPPGGYIPFTDLDQSVAARMLSPAAMSRKSGDVVINELASLRKSLSMPPRVIDGVDLTGIVTSKGQQVYDRWQELTGEIAPGGTNLHDALKTLVTSKAYRALPQASTENDPFNPRAQAVQRIMGRYREAARRQLLQEVPALQQHIIQTREARASKMSAAGALLERLQN